MKRVNFGVIAASIAVLLIFLVAASAPEPSEVYITKGNPITAHNAITTSVAVGSCTAINMAKFNAGTVQATRSSGTGTVSIAVMTCETSGGTYVTPYVYDGAAAVATSSGLQAFPALVTYAGSSFCNRSWSLKNINSRFIKLVPTISGTATYTIKFTPAKQP